MNKKITQLMVVGSLVFFSGCSLLGNKESATMTTTESTTDESPTTPSTAETQKMMAAFQAGTSMRCTMTNTKEGGTITFLAKDKKSKSTITNPTAPEKLSYMINDGQFVYIWTSDETTGFKTTLPTEAEMAANKEKLENLESQMPDFSKPEVQKEYSDQGFAIDCQPGTVAESEFTPPTTIQFQDLSTMMQNAMESIPKMPAQ